MALRWIFILSKKLFIMNNEGKKKMRVAIIGIVTSPSNHNGLGFKAENLIKSLKNKFNITFFGSHKKLNYDGANFKYIPFDAQGIPYHSLSILYSLFFVDILLIFGIAGAWLFPLIRIFTKKKIIVSINALEWQNSKLSFLSKKYLFWAESMTVKYSHSHISDNEAIQDYIASEYGILSRIIEYGGDHALKIDITKESLSHYPFLSKPYAFKTCVIEPESDVHLVLDAFVKTQKMPLVLAGNWDKSEYSRSLKLQYNNHPNVHIYDFDKVNIDLLKSNASLYIHGHSTPETNSSLIEAMHLGIPVLAFRDSFNLMTTERRAIYFLNLDELIFEINEIYMTKLNTIGQKMSIIAQAKHTWNHIGFKYEKVIEETFKTTNKMNVKPEIKRINYKKLIQMGHAHLKNNTD